MQNFFRSLESAERHFLGCCPSTWSFFTASKLPPLIDEITYTAPNTGYAIPLAIAASHLGLTDTGKFRSQREDGDTEGNPSLSGTALDTMAVSFLVLFFAGMQLAFCETELYVNEYFNSHLYHERVFVWSRLQFWKCKDGARESQLWVKTEDSPSMLALASKGSCSGDNAMACKGASRVRSDAQGICSHVTSCLLITSL